MFGLFKSKPKEISVDDKVWMTSNAKWAACAAVHSSTANVTFLFWFKDTAKSLEQYLAASGVADAAIKDARFCTQAAGPIIFIEHFPLRNEEQQVYEKLGLQEAVVYSSLDEAIFQLFGGEKIVKLMQQMGMKENEMVEHKMISTSIARAQEKIEKSAQIHINASSQAAWLQQAGEM